MTGLGWVSALGSGRARALEALSKAPSSKPAPVFDPHSEGLPVPAAPLYTADENSLRDALARLGPNDLVDDAELHLAAAAAKMAIEDAGAQSLLGEAALVLTYEAPGLDRILRGLFHDFVSSEAKSGATPEQIFEHLFNVHKDAAYGMHSFLHLHSLAKALNIHGPTLFVNNACASGLYALEAAARSISEGHVDVAMAVAAESSRFPAKRLWFAEGGLYSTDGRIRPFDSNRSGLILGEGGAAWVLEPLEAAMARGARAQWEYIGGGFNQEGWKVTIPNFSEPYYEQAILKALKTAQVAAEDVDVIVAHGAGTALSDAYEAKGITAVFGDWPKRPLITCLKGWIGHTLGASAAIETALVLTCLEAGFLPGAAGFENSDPRLRMEPIRQPTPSAARTVLKVSNGFAGFNAASIFRRIPE